jgi:hypothetical protein
MSIRGCAGCDKARHSGWAWVRASRPRHASGVCRVRIPRRC